VEFVNLSTTATSPQLERSLKCIPTAEITSQQQLVKVGGGVNMNLSEILGSLKRDKKEKKGFGTPPDS